MNVTTRYNRRILALVLAAGTILLIIGIALAFESAPKEDPDWIRFPPTIRVGSDTPWAKTAVQVKYTENGEMALTINCEGTTLVSVTDFLPFEWEAKSMFHLKAILGNSLLEASTKSYNMDELMITDKGTAPFLTRRCSCRYGECGIDCSTEIDKITYVSNHVAINNPNAKCGCEQAAAYEQSFLVEESADLIIRFSKDNVISKRNGLTSVRFPIICPFSPTVLFSENKPDRVEDPIEVSSADYYDVQLNNVRYFHPNIRIWYTFQEGELAEQPNLVKQNVQPTASINYPAIIWQSEDVLTPSITYRDIGAERKKTSHSILSGILIGLGAALATSPLSGLLTMSKKESVSNQIIEATGKIGDGDDTTEKEDF